MEKIVIVGGGASGVVTSIFAKNKNNEVIILERNSSPLKKLLMTGNGKCNYFNEVYSMKNYHSQDISIVDQIISDYNITMVKEFFDSLGVIPKIKNGYYYPFSNQAVTIKNVLLEEALRKGVKIVCDSLVTGIVKVKKGFIVVTEKGEYPCDKVVLACGSKAYPKTGSDGCGYRFLEKFHHTIVKPLPALVQLTSNFSYLKEWDGIRSDVELELFEDDKYAGREEGEIQLTSYGISGICTFNLSHIVTRGLEEGRKEVIKINFVPFIKTLITPWIDQYSKKNSHKTIEKLLEGFLNYKLVDVLLKISNISKDSYYLDLKKEEKFLLCKNLRAFPVEVTGTKGFLFSQVCNGGVKLDEIHEDTMESRLIKGLYITGELLDINGNCGGYNLTTCWISGMLAGKDIGGNYD